MENNRQNTDLGERVKSGYSWTLLGNAVGQPISFIFGVILARILSPSDFGILASCVVFTEVGNTLVAASYTSGLIQKKELNDRDLSTGFVLQLVTGIILITAIIGISYLAADLIKDPLVHPVLSALSLNFIFLAFRGIPTVLIQRALNFQLLAKIGLVERAGYGIIASAAAFMGFGVWSLVLGFLSSKLISAILVYVAAKWKVSFVFNKNSAVYLLKISSRFALKDVLDELSRNIGYFIIGWRLGVRPLGFYSRAVSLMTLPITSFSKSLENVLFPAFSQIQDDKDRLQNGLLKASCVIAMTTFPLLIGLLVVAPTFIPVVYGAKWIPTVVPLQIICIAGLFYAIDSPVVSLINAKAFLTAEIKRQTIHLVLLVSGVTLGSLWSLSGAAWGVTTAAGIYWVLLLQLLKNRMDLRWSNYLISFLPAVIASSMMAGSVLAFQKILASLTVAGDISILVGSIITGVVSYFVSLLIIRKFVRNSILRDAFKEIDYFILKNWMNVTTVFNRKEKLEKL